MASKLDGAFVVRGDGLIQSAGVFLITADVEVQLPVGLGARHMAAAAVTAYTAATAVVVSATDGNVRAFSGGQMVLQMDPDVPYGPVMLDGQEDRFRVSNSRQYVLTCFPMRAR